MWSVYVSWTQLINIAAAYKFIKVPFGVCVDLGGHMNIMHCHNLQSSTMTRSTATVADTGDASPVRPSSSPQSNAWGLHPPQARFGALCHNSSRRPCLCPDCAGRLDQQQQPLHSIGSQVKLRPLGDAEMPPSQVPSVHCLLHHQVYQASWYWITGTRPETYWLQPLPPWLVALIRSKYDCTALPFSAWTASYNMQCHTSLFVNCDHVLVLMIFLWQNPK